MKKSADDIKAYINSGDSEFDQAHHVFFFNLLLDNRLFTRLQYEGLDLKRKLSVYLC